MKIAPVPANEQARLKVHSGYFDLDTLPEKDFDDITSIASEICNTPISLITIIDAEKQWFKSAHGIKNPGTPTGNSFFTHTIDTPKDVFIVEDLTKDKRFSKDTFVKKKPHAVFYAGVTLRNPEGYVLGVLSVLDTKARKLSSRQTKTLQALARQVVALLELKKKDLELKQKQTELTSAVADLEKIIHIASHDLKSPLNNIISLTHLLKDDYSKQLDEEGNEYITFLNEAAYRLSDLVSGIVIYTRSTQLPIEQKEQINIAELIDEVTALLNLPEHATVKYKKDIGSIYASRVMLKQLLLQLIQNAVQYNENGKIKVEVRFHENKHSYTFEIKDNGPGIADEDKEKIFDLFERLQKKIKDGENMGIGLSVAKRLVERCGGEIKVDTEPGKGSTFVFTIPK